MKQNRLHLIMKTACIFAVFLLFSPQVKSQQIHSGKLQDGIDSLRFAQGDVTDCSSITWELQAYGLNAVPLLIAKLDDTTQTNAFVTGRIPLKLTVGGLAFITLDRIIHLPYFEVLHMQFCVISGEQSGFPDGFLSYICSNGQDVKNCVSKWYNENKSKLVRVTVPSKDQSSCMKDRGIDAYYIKK